MFFKLVLKGFKLKKLGVEPKNGSTGSTSRGIGQSVMLVRSSTGRGKPKVSLSPSGLLFPVEVTLFLVKVRLRPNGHLPSI